MSDARAGTAGNDAPVKRASIVLMTLASASFLMTLDSSVKSFSIATVAERWGRRATST